MHNHNTVIVLLRQKKWPKSILTSSAASDLLASAVLFEGKFLLKLFVKIHRVITVMPSCLLLKIEQLVNYHSKCSRQTSLVEYLPSAGQVFQMVELFQKVDVYYDPSAVKLFQMVVQGDN